MVKTTLISVSFAEHSPEVITIDLPAATLMKSSTSIIAKKEGRFKEPGTSPRVSPSQIHGGQLSDFEVQGLDGGEQPSLWPSGHRHAYVSLLHGVDESLQYRGYLLSWLVQRRALAKLRVQADVVLMVGFSNGSRAEVTHPIILADLALLRRLEVVVYYLPRLAPVDVVDQTILSEQLLQQHDNKEKYSSNDSQVPQQVAAHAKRVFLEMTMLKIVPWSFTQYTSLQFLDADVLPFKNMDCLFHLPVNTFISANKSPLNAGWFLVRPSLREYRRLRELAVWRLHTPWDQAVGWDAALLPAHSPLTHPSALGGTEDQSSSSNSSSSSSYVLPSGLLRLRRRRTWSNARTPSVSKVDTVNNSSIGSSIGNSDGANDVSISDKDPERSAGAGAGPDGWVRDWSFHGAELEQGLLSKHFLLDRHRALIFDYNHAVLFSPDRPQLFQSVRSRRNRGQRLWLADWTEAEEEEEEEVQRAREGASGGEASGVGGGGGGGGVGGGGGGASKLASWLQILARVVPAGAAEAVVVEEATSRPRGSRGNHTISLSSSNSTSGGSGGSGSTIYLWPIPLPCGSELLSGRSQLLTGALGPAGAAVSTAASALALLPSRRRLQTVAARLHRRGRQRDNLVGALGCSPGQLAADS